MSRFLMAALVLAVADCGGAVKQLASRAAFDLDCPESKLQIVDIDERTMGVRGCEKKAVYIWACQTERYATSCTWVLNSPGQDAQALIRPAAPVESREPAGTPSTQPTAPDVPPGQP